MVKIKFICKYCNHTWTETFTEITDLSNKECPVCKDKNLIKIKGAKLDPFSYNVDRFFKRKKEDG